MFQKQQPPEQSLNRIIPVSNRPGGCGERSRLWERNRSSNRLPRQLLVLLGFVGRLVTGFRLRLGGRLGYFLVHFIIFLLLLRSQQLQRFALIFLSQQLLRFVLIFFLQLGELVLLLSGQVQLSLNVGGQDLAAAAPGRRRTSRPLGASRSFGRSRPFKTARSARYAPAAPAELRRRSSSGLRSAVPRPCPDTRRAVYGQLASGRESAAWPGDPDPGWPW